MNHRYPSGVGRGYSLGRERTCCSGIPRERNIPIPIDLNNDGTTEVGVFRPSTRQFIVKTNPVTRINYGVGTDKPVRSWFSHDGTSRIGVFRSGQFIINNDPITRYNFGVSTDQPITGIWV